MDTEYLNSNALLAYDKGKADGVEQTVEMLREWKRHHDIMSDPKSLHYSMCIQEILEKLEDSK